MVSVWCECVCGCVMWYVCGRCVISKCICRVCGVLICGMGGVCVCVCVVCICDLVYVYGMYRGFICMWCMFL